MRGRRSRRTKRDFLRSHSRYAMPLSHRILLDGRRRVIVCFVFIAVVAFNLVAIAYVTTDSASRANGFLARQRTSWSHEKTNGQSANETTSTIEKKSREKCESMKIDELDPREVPVGRSTFFIETNRRAAVALTPRQSCSVESAARWAWF